MRLKIPMFALVAMLLVPLHLEANGVSRSAGQGRGDAPSIGIERGQRAPAFSLRDQFGQAESNETLKGSNGTVLLFFRSADW